MSVPFYSSMPTRDMLVLFDAANPQHVALLRDRFEEMYKLIDDYESDLQVQLDQRDEHIRSLENQLASADEDARDEQDEIARLQDALGQIEQICRDNPPT